MSEEHDEKYFYNKTLNDLNEHMCVTDPEYRRKGFPMNKPVGILSWIIMKLAILDKRVSDMESKTDTVKSFGVPIDKAGNRC